MTQEEKDDLKYVSIWLASVAVIVVITFVVSALLN
jgi:hypothetical protein